MFVVVWRSGRQGSRYAACIISWLVLEVVFAKPTISTIQRLHGHGGIITKSLIFVVELVVVDDVCHQIERDLQIYVHL